jgi:predicted nuclease of predicted toxin-antitoxin system
MKLLIDENMSWLRLGARLRTDGHDVVLVQDAGLLGVSDPELFAWAISQDRVVLSRDRKDYLNLHHLIMVAQGHHPGVLLIRFDANARHNMSERAIATAVGKLAASGIAVADQVHFLNHWR